MKSMSDLLIDLPENDYEEAASDLQSNEEELETRENEAANLKCEFNELISRLQKESSKLSKEVTVTESSSDVKPKFKPKDLRIPKWDGNVVNFNAWKLRIVDYFKLTGLETEQEQLTMFLYKDVLPAYIQSTSQDCTSVDKSNGIWERLESKFPKCAIPKAVLANLKDTKPMTSNTAREMRRVLEQIKQYARNTEQAGCDSDLQCHVTLDLID